MFRARLPLVVSFICATLIASFLPANSASIAGTKCTKLNSSKTISNIKYTCVKSGKNLVWNKGTKVTTESKSPTNSSTTVEKLPSKPEPKAGDYCQTADENAIRSVSNGKLICKKDADGKWFHWITYMEESNSPNSSTSIQNQTPQNNLPKEGSVCLKIGEKILATQGYYRCNWPGGPVSTGTWRFFDSKKLSTSSSNSYKATPTHLGICENSGDTFDVTNGYLECRWTSGKKLQWIKINTVKQTFVNSVSPAGIEVCKLSNADAVAQTGRNYGAGKVGFPMDRTTKNGVFPTGSNEVLIVGVDFPELRGGNNINSIFSEDIKWLQDWYRYFSGGKANFNVSTIDHWINAPKSAASYVKTGNDGLSAGSNRFLADAAQSFVDLITKEIDLRKFSTVYMMFPDGETTFDMDLIVRNEAFKIKEGQKNLNFFGWGHDMEMQEALRWAFYVHETLHDFDIIGHAPGNGWPYGIMQSQAGVSMAMNPYEQFLLDWLPSNQIYCQDKASLDKVTISLSPVEREDKQTKMAIIKLSSTKAVVIESHGIDKWSSFNTGDRAFPPGFYSVMAYVVDLNKAVAPPVTADQRSLSNQDYAWAVLAKVSGGKSTSFPYFPAAFGEDIYGPVAVLGDTIEVEGIKIKFIETGDFETIEISKIS